MMSFSDVVDDVEVRHRIYGVAFISVTAVYIIFHFLLLVGDACINIVTSLKRRYQIRQHKLRLEKKKEEKAIQDKKRRFLPYQLELQQVVTPQKS